VDFFASQDAARRKTKRLVAFFLLAVLLIVLAVYAASLVIFIGMNIRVEEPNPLPLWNPGLFFAVAAGTITVILLGSLYKLSALSSGGESVASLLGGRPVDANTRDTDERRLLNVVEEMAIASGVPVPAVFLLPGEKGINAFAAGFSPQDAVIGVTEGCVRILSRDELQGVIAHEFSHILNGDMRLNIRLIGVLHGILLIALIGYYALHAGRGRGKGNAQIALLGLVLLVVGYIGVIFGRIIKSAVSRQREYLADASAVQFTRNPAGISGALQKIGGLVFGSRLSTPKAEEASHLLFGNGLRQRMSGLLSTHPPLAERIRRIDPSFDGVFPRIESSVAAASAAPEVEGLAAAGLAPSAAGAPRRPVGAIDPRAVTKRVGTLDRDHLAYAGRLLSRLPRDLIESAREPSASQGIVYALLMDPGRETRKRQLERLKRSTEPFLYRETLRLLPAVDAAPRETRLPLIDLVMPPLRRLSSGQFQSFYQNVQALVSADERIDLFEFTLQRILLRHIAPHFGRFTPPRIRYHSLRGLLPHCSTLLSALAHQGHRDSAQAESAFREGWRRIGLAVEGSPFRPRQACGLAEVDRALGELALAAPGPKRRIVEASAACIAFDRKVTIEEGELLRAVTDSLDCPLPPFIPGQEI
jgi:Zn-dependent protease with chaperone function